MLQQVCEYIHNFFIKEARVGSYSIVGGMISLDFLKDGQRFWITNSDLNDGVYTYHADHICNDDDDAVVGLSDEDFYGTVCAMSVPPALVALSGEIKSWVEKYSESVNSPFTSENVIGVYSYTKAQSGSGNSAAPASWQDIYSKRLDTWRKLSL